MTNINNYVEDKAERLLSESDSFYLPIDLDRITQHLKVELQALQLEDEVSGFCVVKANKVHIGYNANHPPTRRRFTVAHEIGHYWLHALQTPIFIDKIKFDRNSNSSTGKSQQEREANAFAAALLMPKKLIKEEILRLNKAGCYEGHEEFISKLASRFNVSNHALTIRLTNLGLIDYNEYA